MITGGFDDSCIVASYDAEADAAYVWFVCPNTCDRVERTVECGHGVQLDIDRNGNVLGVELLYPGAAHRARTAASEGGSQALTP